MYFSLKMKTLKILFLIALIKVALPIGTVIAQGVPADSITTTPQISSSPQWFNNFKIRGYAQLRYNRLLETNEDLGCEQCDKSWGGDGGFFLRRTRIIFYGQIHPRVYFYIQPDFVSSAGSTSNIAQIRDAYFDVGLNADNSMRLRIGQSKVPFGFENMQSSQNRLPLDRNDGLNSAVANERDMGVFFYWAPVKVRALFSSLVREGLKGSGDYGVFAFGLYNGQTANRVEMNDEPHIVTRFSYPLQINSQVLELGVQAYTGNYVMYDNQISDGVITSANNSYRDQRAAISTILYPKPFGIQAEYNIGEGPEFDKETGSIQVKSLQGGYATFNYLINYKNQKIYPFTRFQRYQGGKKHERDARSYDVTELEVGIEWLPVPNFELVVMYTMSERRYEDFQLQDNLQKGNLLRIQAQVNFR